MQEADSGYPKTEMKELPRINEGHARTNWRHAVAAYTEPRVLQVLALGFASGLPLLLTYSTLSAWLATGGVRRAAIGTFALVGTPYAFKFLWAPLMDRVPPPLPLGRRRGWGITIQILLIGAILGLGLCNPKHNLPLMAAFAVLVAFLSASQDIVIDAWRVESLNRDQQAPGAAMIQSGYRIGMLVSGAGGLLIAAYAGWFAAYATMAALLGVGLTGVFAGPGTEGLGGNFTCCGIGMACDSPRVFDRRDRSLSRFHASAALARHPDRHFRIQAGRGNGGSDVNAALYIAGIFAP